jgi:hypothetical protein
MNERDVGTHLEDGLLDDDTLVEALRHLIKVDGTLGRESGHEALLLGSPLTFTLSLSCLTSLMLTSASSKARAISVSMEPRT